MGIAREIEGDSNMKTARQTQKLRQCVTCKQFRPIERFRFSTSKQCRGCQSRAASSRLKYPDFTPPPEFQLLNSLKHVPGSSGVYLFVLNGRIQYIGQTMNISRRIYDHGLFVQLPNLRVFFREIHDCKNRRDLEYHLIRTLSPRLNRTHIRGIL
jgi:hypothetical protein